jgi:hypothetical protein
MKNRAFILSLPLLSPCAGQQPAAAQDPADVRSALIQSQIVEFKPSLRRDPFLLPAPENLHADRQTSTLIEDIVIIGRITYNRKAYAIAVDASGNTRHFTVGHQFLDGEITQITEKEVIFSQWNPESGKQSARQTVTRIIKREEAR